MAIPVLLVGHSFTKRLVKYMKEVGKQNFDVPGVALTVHNHCKGGAKLEFVQSPETRSQVALLQPRVIVIDVGTNDLDDPHVRPETLANQLFNFAEFLHFGYSVDHVILLPVLPRFRGKFQAHVPDFAEKVERFNTALRALCKECVQAGGGVHFWSHKRINTLLPTLVFDGVHLNQAGMVRYFYSVRLAVKLFATAVAANK